MDRRRFLTKAGVAVAGAAAVLDAPNVIAQQKYQWKMATSWTPALDILQGNAQRFAKFVDELSAGRMKIQVYAAGELIPAFGVFDACSQGTIESYNSAAYYWAGKEPASQWFTTVPFGMDAQAHLAWFYEGDGIKLWEETYAPFGMVPRPSGATGIQMGGWFRKKITRVEDLKGLKFRIPGLGGKVYAKAGATVVLTPGGEIYTALERGVIDGAEWVGPHDDMKLGLHNAAKFYHFPGWHEPSTYGEFVFNKKAYDALPADLKHILDYSATAVHSRFIAEYDTKNAAGLQKIKTEMKGKVELVPFPAAVLKELRKLALEVNKEESEKTPIAKKVYASFTKFQSQMSDWAVVAEDAYQRYIRA